MVIGQVCHSSLGGSSRAACRLANALSKRGHTVHTFSYGPIPWALDAHICQHVFRKSNIELAAPLYRDWSSSDRGGFASFLACVLHDHPLDILHYHYAQPFAAVVQQMLPKLRNSMPVTVGTLHGTDLTGSLGDAAELARLNDDLSATGVLTTVSQYMRNLSNNVLSAGIDANVLPNFVEDEWPEPDTGSAPESRPPKRSIILHVSNFRAAKDVGLLAELFLRICQQTAAELWLVGDGPEMPELRQRLDKPPVGSTIRYFGVCLDPARFFRQATILLSTSTEESFGLSILEAMASGLPVVATAVGGVPELVQDDDTGILFDPQLTDSAVDRIVSLLASPTRLSAMRERSIERARPLREAHVVSMYEDLYREKLGQGLLSAG